MKRFKINWIAVFLFSFLLNNSLIAQTCPDKDAIFDSIASNLTFVTNANDSGSTVNFGSIINIQISYSYYFGTKLNCSKDDQQKKSEDWLSKLYPVINSIIYKDKLLFNRLNSYKEKKDTTYYWDKEVCKGFDSTNKSSYLTKVHWVANFQCQLSGVFEDPKKKETVSNLWKNNYGNGPEANLAFTLGWENKIIEKPIGLTLVYYEWWRILLGVLLILCLLLLLIPIGNDKFRMLRDDQGKCNDSSKNPFSLSRVQVFFWTYIIFGFAIYLWVTTHNFPNISASQLVLLGIVAGQRIIAQIIDSGGNPDKDVNNFAPKSNNNQKGNDNCSGGFFIDLISDSSGLSITRLQYVIATIIFMVVFITNAFENFNLMSFTVQQLGLMGTSAGLYLWNKQLDQKNAPFDLKIAIEPGDLADVDIIKAFNDNPPKTINAKLDEKLMDAPPGVGKYNFVLKNVSPGKHKLSITCVIKVKEADITLMGVLEGDFSIASSLPGPQSVKMNKKA